MLKGGQITFKIGTDAASQDSVTITLPAAAAANLDAGLASDDLTANSGASQALTNVTNAISALDQLQASLEGSLVGFLGAAQNLTLSESVLTNLRTGLLDKPATFEMAELLAHTVSKEILKPAAPAIAGGYPLPWAPCCRAPACNPWSQRKPPFKRRSRKSQRTKWRQNRRQAGRGTTPSLPPVASPTKASMSRYSPELRAAYPAFIPTSSGNRP